MTDVFRLFINNQHYFPALCLGYNVFHWLVEAGWRIFAPGNKFFILSARCVGCPIKGIKNGCPCIVEIRGTQGCALVGDPARAVGECRDVAKASWRQPLRVDGPKASQRSIINYEINFCIDQAKTHREVRFWFDLSYDATKVHVQMLRIKLCCFLFVFCRKVLPWERVYKMARPKTRDT